MKVAIYMRVGNKNQLDSKADAEKKRQELIHYCEKKKHQIVNEYVSHQGSEAEAARLEEIKKLIAEKKIAEKKIDGVVVSDYKSISSDVNKVMEFSDFIEKHHGTLLCSSSARAKGDKDSIVRKVDKL